ncbi:MAG: 50S ribosomal protein L10 [bacterium]|jgi:large subunit ribosomal protein L10|nr:50S ribosomal protein L10 [bacterium]|tara:strand:+ start:363 stop:884 length:522 start_codon:yes stop_codon:yes gene_type:complete
MGQEYKKNVIDQLTGKIKEAEFATMTDFSGLKVAEINDLRDQLREAGGEYRVVKNRLFKLAMNNLSPEGDIASFMKGPTGVVFSQEDAFKPVKVAVDFSKKLKKFTIKGGIAGCRILTEQEVQEVAKIPSKEYLYATVVGAFQAPMGGMVTTLSGILSKFVNVLREISDQKAA